MTWNVKSPSKAVRFLCLWVFFFTWSQNSSWISRSVFPKSTMMTLQSWHLSAHKQLECKHIQHSLLLECTLSDHSQHELFVKIQFVIISTKVQQSRQLLWEWSHRQQFYNVPWECREELLMFFPGTVCLEREVYLVSFVPTVLMETLMDQTAIIKFSFKKLA